ncbi:MAG: 50S ribosomal protein L9 [bacterium]|nr:50S ribosomal protein L9 [bacterium]MDZ4299713.1 50S ribosomal protein L9 [Candidatus Sungbacteria bacterium]
MKVILLRDIPSLGQRGALKDVSAGHARNFLLPRGLARAATPGDSRVLEQTHQHKEKHTAAAQSAYHDTAQRLAGITLMFTRKASPTGTLFAALGAQDIRSVLMREYAITVNEEWIIFTEPIKKIGTYEITIHFPSGEKGMIKVQVNTEL